MDYHATGVTILIVQAILLKTNWLNFEVWRSKWSKKKKKKTKMIKKKSNAKVKFIIMAILHNY